MAVVPEDIWGVDDYYLCELISKGVKVAYL